jgi:hypothetical protein
LEETETALVDSTANAQSVAAKAKERHRSARYGLCFTLLLLLGVSAVFAFMIGYIKVTAMVGVTGRRTRVPGYKGWIIPIAAFALVTAVLVSLGFRAARLLRGPLRLLLWS